MGQLVTTVAGGFAGFLIGGPLGAQIGMTLGGMVGATLFGPTIKGPRLNDLKVSASTYGVAIPEVWGTVRVGGNMIWTTGIKETKKTSRQGKGGPKQTTYTYDATFAVGLCKGPISDVLRIWADGKLIYDKTNGASRNPASAGNSAVFEAVQTVLTGSTKKAKLNFRVYRGGEDQLPDSLIEADKGVGNVSAHRGLAYVVFEKLQLEDFGNRIPQLTFEVSRQRSNSYPSIVVTNSDGSGTIPNVTARAWYPDWETGKLLSIRSDRADILDLNTMKSLLYRDIDLRSNYRMKYVAGANQWLTVPSGRNSAPIEVWNTLSLTRVVSWGETSNSLTGFINSDGTYHLGNAGPLGYGRFGGGGRLYIASNMRGRTYGIIGGAAVFNVATPFTPWTYLEGIIDGASPDIIGYRAVSGQLQLSFCSIAGFTGTALLRPFDGEDLSLGGALYDRTDNCVFGWGVSGGQTCFFKWNRSTGAYKFRVKHPGLPRPMSIMEYSRLGGGTFGYGYAGFQQTSRLIEIDLQNGSIVTNQTFTESAFGNSLSFGDGQQWDDNTKSLIVETAGAFRRVFFGAGVTKLSVATVVRDVCLYSNLLTEADIDMTGLNADELVGYMIDRETTGRDVLKQLATGFLFDGFESDDKLKFKSRGSAPVVTIPENWIGRNSDGIVVRETLRQELEMPVRITVNFYDTTRDHQQGSQHDKRKSNPYPTMFSAKEEIIELPISWLPDDAKRCAQKILKMTWANRTDYAMDLPWRYLKYDPTDVVKVTLDDGTVHTIRLGEVTIGADFAIEATGVSEVAAAYVSTAKGATSEAPVQVIDLGLPAYPIVINTPLLRDIDYDTTGNASCYITANSENTFTSAAVYMDDGYEFINVAVIVNAPTQGVVINKLPDTKAYESTDEETVLEVRLLNDDDELEAVTQDDMLTKFVNGALIGGEVIQFRDAEQREDGIWLLSGILRARRGTNYAVTGHAVGETFVLLNDENISRFQRPPADYSVTREFRAVTSGGLLEDANGVTVTLSPRDLAPYTPEDVKITDDGTTVTITMSRRSRITAPLADGTGTIHYKEGDKTSAKIAYNVWKGLGLANATTQATPTVSGNIPLFDVNGDELPTTFTFPLDALEGNPQFLLRLAEIGVVEGTPKIIEFERLGQDRWNAVDLY
ncbi:putative tail protein [Citromicrobium phage vB_CbaS-RXM]|nr:putative tail protein [Citromicrobium phage vB_CbaS-RXM]